MTLSVLILTRNRQEELIQCLSSLKRELKNLLEIIVLDNGSEPPVGESVYSGFPHVRFLRSDKNLGVARGRNILAQEAQGKLLWFLDDDAILETQGASELIFRYFQNASLGVVSFKVINAFNGEEEVRCIPNRKKGLTNQDVPASYFVGCSFVVRKKTFLEGGGFWEDLFYSCEELDLSYRILDLQYTLIRSSVLEVKHSYLPSSSRTSSWIYFNTRNRVWTALRNLPLRYVISQSLLWWAYTAWIALGERKLNVWFSGLRDCVQGANEAFIKRKVISIKALQTVASLGGRTWY